mmetsp:Transcript_18202/g.31011  ORF Transcript_18202/g.31011 Transcript_18202/m.31011 type:complete len:156 (+) Transcript_18202:1705-2172(+)
MPGWRSQLWCFFDEIDALVGKRAMSQGASENSTGVQGRVLSTMLNEMDGIQTSAGLLVLAATNRLDMIDDALLRPGRFDRLVHVPLPSEEDRREILDIHMEAIPLEGDRQETIKTLATQTEGLSGAELENCCREAAMTALRNGQQAVTIQDFSTT